MKLLKLSNSLRGALQDDVAVQLGVSPQRIGQVIKANKLKVINTQDFNSADKNLLSDQGYSMKGRGRRPNFLTLSVIQDIAHAMGRSDKMKSYSQEPETPLLADYIDIDKARGHRIGQFDLAVLENHIIQKQRSVREAFPKDDRDKIYGYIKKCIKACFVARASGTYKEISVGQLYDVIALIKSLTIAEIGAAVLVGRKDRELQRLGSVLARGQRELPTSVSYVSDSEFIEI